MKYLLLLIFATNSFAMSSTKDDFNKNVELLTEAIYFEARSSNFQERLLIMSVIFNRLEHKVFPDTIREVLYQPYQFSYTLNKNRSFEEKGAYKQAKRMAKLAYIDYLDGKWTDWSNGALYYYNPSITTTPPAWVDEKYKIRYNYNGIKFEHKFYKWHKLA